MVIDGNWTCHEDRFIMYKNTKKKTQTESHSCMPETTRILYVNNTSIKKRREKSGGTNKSKGQR